MVHFSLPDSGAVLGARRQEVCARGQRGASVTRASDVTAPAVRPRPLRPRSLGRCTSSDVSPGETVVLSRPRRQAGVLLAAHRDLLGRSWPHRGQFASSRPRSRAAAPLSIVFGLHALTSTVSGGIGTPLQSGPLRKSNRCRVPLPPVVQLSRARGIARRPRDGCLHQGAAVWSCAPAARPRREPGTDGRLLLLAPRAAVRSAIGGHCDSAPVMDEQKFRDVRLALAARTARFARCCR